MIKCLRCGLEYNDEYYHYCGGANSNTVTFVDPSWKYVDNIFGFPTRIRGFEKVSEEQWNRDYPGLDPVIYQNIKLPKRATIGSAGYDFFTPYEFRLLPGQEIKINTGIKAYMMMDEKLEISPRSGLGFKYYLRLANTIGKIDSDYFNNPETEGHIYIKIRNEGNQDVFIESGKAFAQGSFEKYLLADGDSFITGNFRIGGTGSTDKNT